MPRPPSPYLTTRSDAAQAAAHPAGVDRDPLVYTARKPRRQGLLKGRLHPRLGVLGERTAWEGMGGYPPPPPNLQRKHLRVGLRAQGVRYAKLARPAELEAAPAFRLSAAGLLCNLMYMLFQARSGRT